MRTPRLLRCLEATCNWQQLPVFSEADDSHDSYKRAVAVYKDGSVVGHVEGAPA